MREGRSFDLFTGMLLVLVYTLTNSSSAFASTLSVDKEPLDQVIDWDATRQVAVGNNFAVSTRFGDVHPLTVQTSGKYILIVESYEAPLVLWVSRDSTPLAMARRVKEGQFRYRLDIDLESGGEYRVGVGISDQTKPPVRYRLGAYSSGAPNFPPDPKRPVDSLIEGTSRFSFAQSSYPCFGWHARYFKMRVSDRDQRWLQASVEAKGFVPSVYILDPVTQVWLGHGWYNTRRRESQQIARVEGDEVELVVVARDTDLKIPAATLGDFVLSAHFSHRDPSQGVIAKTYGFLSHPFSSWLIGALVGIISSYFFYKHSITRRDILYTVVADRTVLHQERTQASRLQVIHEGRSVSEHVGWCSVEVRFKGPSDLHNANVVEPIQLHFNNT